MEEQNHLSPSSLVWRGEAVTALGCCSVGFHHKLFQCPLPLIPTKQKNFFDFILLEAHIIKLSQQMQEFSCLEEEGGGKNDVIMDGYTKTAGNGSEHSWNSFVLLPPLCSGWAPAPQHHPELCP